jgi:hypothetical protein
MVLLCTRFRLYSWWLSCMVALITFLHGFLFVTGISEVSNTSTPTPSGANLSSKRSGCAPCAEVGPFCISSCSHQCSSAGDHPQQPQREMYRHPALSFPPHQRPTGQKLSFIPLGCSWSLFSMKYRNFQRQFFVLCISAMSTSIGQSGKVKAHRPRLHTSPLPRTAQIGDHQIEE